MAEGGEAAGGGPWRGRSGAREPSSLATAVAPGPRGGCAVAAGLAPSRALRRPVVVGGGREEEVGTPGAGESYGASQHPRRWAGGGGLARVPSLSRPARAEAGEQQAGASGFPRSPRPRSRAGGGRR